MTTIAASSPKVIPWTTRARTPLIALTVALVALDAIGLGLRWADAGNQSIGDITPRVLQPRVTAPDAIVSGSDLAGSPSDSTASGAETSSSSAARTTSSGALIGPVAPPVVKPAPSSPSPSNAPVSSPADPLVPLAQIDAAVPGVAQVSAGVGDNSCTTIDLTLLALGDCPVPSGEGPVVLHLGGSLLGQ